MIPRSHRISYWIFAAVLIFSGFMDIFVVRFLVPSWTLGMVSLIFGMFLVYFCSLTKRVEGNVKA